MPAAPAAPPSQVVLDGVCLDDLALAAIGVAPDLDALGDGPPGAHRQRLPLAADALAAGDRVALADPEGTVLATLEVLEPPSPDPAGCAARGTLEWVRPFGRHAFHDLVPGRDAATGALVAPVDAVPTPNQVRAARDAATARDLDVQWLALTGAGRPGAVPAERLVPALLRLAGDAPRPERVLAVPLPPPAAGAATDADRRLALAAWLGASAVATAGAAGESQVAGGPEVVTLPAPVAADAATAGSRPGAVVLLSGLSGSGKSTVARATTDLLRAGGRTVTLLDGDDVRRLLSAGLGFSQEDRDLNVRRIGFVAAEVARHGGLALAAPIAPYAAVRDDVRRMVEEAGARFVLVHVSTPLEVCEQRDRKGLYAAARRGELTGFTGIDDPYEEPVDADLVVDTSTTSVDEAAAAVVAAVRAAGAV